MALILHANVEKPNCLCIYPDRINTVYKLYNLYFITHRQTSKITKRSVGTDSIDNRGGLNEWGTLAVGNNNVMIVRNQKVGVYKKATHTQSGGMLPISAVRTLHASGGFWANASSVGPESARRCTGVR